MEPSTSKGDERNIIDNIDLKKEIEEISRANSLNTYTPRVVRVILEEKFKTNLLDKIREIENLTTEIIQAKEFQNQLNQNIDPQLNLHNLLQHMITQNLNMATQNLQVWQQLKQILQQTTKSI